MQSSSTNKPSLPERLREQRARHLQRPKPIRLLYIVAGFTLLLAGVVMLLAPGPAFVVIPIGLALLSLEFAWAERLLEKALAKGDVAKRKAAATTKTQRILTALAVLLAVGAIVVWGIWRDIPIVPFA
ncbi:MAG: PGPGW domain-containing protein [Solirubrobacterales bacterium]|nr:PGPGW domain-containing protein [Solirubrobacterales bacterium]